MSSKFIDAAEWIDAYRMVLRNTRRDRNHTVIGQGQSDASWLNDVSALLRAAARAAEANDSAHPQGQQNEGAES